MPWRPLCWLLNVISGGSNQESDTRKESDTDNAGSGSGVVNRSKKDERRNKGNKAYKEREEIVITPIPNPSRKTV